MFFQPQRSWKSQAPYNTSVKYVGFCPEKGYSKRLPITLPVCANPIYRHYSGRRHYLLGIGLLYIEFHQSCQNNSTGTIGGKWHYSTGTIGTPPPAVTVYLRAFFFVLVRCGSSS